MAQGLVKLTPKPPTGHTAATAGQLSVITIDNNDYGVKKDSLLTFPDPGFAVTVGMSVSFTLNSGTTCSVTGALMQG